MDLPEGIKIPNAKLIAHGEIIRVKAYQKEGGVFMDEEAINERGWVIFVPEPKTKGKRNERTGK